jgi:SAM-dependent methyltransferase
VTEEPPEDGAGHASFRVGGDAYDRFMGRYSRLLAAPFADAARVRAGEKALDVGCGPGALTEELAARLGPGSVTAVDPSDRFVEECRQRNPGVVVLRGTAEALPVAAGAVDVALAQLVFQFVSDPVRSAAEMARAVGPGGRIGACTWDLGGGMMLLRAFWDAAREFDSRAPVEGSRAISGGPGALAEVFAEAGLRDVESGSLDVEAGYEDFEDLWTGVMEGVGPAGSYAARLPSVQQEELRRRLFARVGSPRAAFSLTARAWFAVAAVHRA